MPFQRLRFFIILIRYFALIFQRFWCKLLSLLPGSSTKIFPCPFDPFAVLLGSILRFLLDKGYKKRENEEARTICSLNTTKKLTQNRDMLDYVPLHTFSKAFEREIVFFFSFSPYWNVIPLGSTHPRREPRPGHRDVIRGLPPLARSAFPELSSRTTQETATTTPKEISTQVEHLSLEISSFETRSKCLTHTG